MDGLGYLTPDIQKLIRANHTAPADRVLTALSNSPYVHEILDMDPPITKDPPLYQLLHLWYSVEHLNLVIRYIPQDTPEESNTPPAVGYLSLAHQHGHDKPSVDDIVDFSVGIAELPILCELLGCDVFDEKYQI